MQQSRPRISGLSLQPPQRRLFERHVRAGAGDGSNLGFRERGQDLQSERRRRLRIADQPQAHVETGHPLSGLHDHVRDLEVEERRLGEARDLVDREPWVAEDREQDARIVVLQQERPFAIALPSPRAESSPSARGFASGPTCSDAFPTCRPPTDPLRRGPLRPPRRSGEQPGELFVRIPVDRQCDPIRQRRHRRSADERLTTPGSAERHQQGRVEHHGLGRREAQRAVREIHAVLLAQLLLALEHDVECGGGRAGDSHSLRYYASAVAP